MTGFSIGALDGGPILHNLPALWAGMQLTLVLTFLAILGGFVLGTLLAIAQLSSVSLVARAATIYVSFFRSIPLILAVFWFYFLVPLLLGHPVGPFFSVLVGFVFFEGAYFAEIVRAGIQSVRQGQIAAAYASGLTATQTLRYVVLPQAFRNMLPVLLTRSIVIFQDTSLAFVVSLTDFLTATSIVADRDGRPVELYLFAAAVYLTLSSIADLGVRWSQWKLAA
jgi:glutamate/aspartate transport system permease protein